MTILVLVDWYLPSFRAGGPVRAVANRIEAFGDEYHFKVLTGDRDWREAEPHAGVESGRWYKVGKASVMYVSPRQLYSPFFLRVLRDESYNAVHIHGFFSLGFVALTLLLRRLRLIRQAPTVLAPLGSFSTGHLEIRPLKKRLYIEVTKRLGLFRDVIWQASTSHEEADIRRLFGANVPVLIAQDMPGAATVDEHGTLRPAKVSGQLKLLYVSRVTRKKNLDGALQMLRELRGDIEFNIYGPVDDPAYWEECQQIIQTLPPNIRVKYHGAIPGEEVYTLMKSHHLFFMPTHGENFGYVILEALASGCPVLISDQTPWLELEARGVGWDIPLSEPERFRSTLQACVDMEEAAYQVWSKGALEYGASCMHDSRAADENHALLSYLTDLARKVVNSSSAERQHE